jgi:xanthine dehydrogenase accessory factor
VNDWIEALRSRLRAQPAVVRVAVAQARGSTPREAGAVMLVDAGTLFGTIGGGELEWRAEKMARQMLAAPQPRVQVERWPLGPELGQCCGGSVTLWFERLDAHDLAVFDELAARIDRGEHGWLLTRAAGAVGAGCGHDPLQERPTRQWLDAPPASADPQALVEAIAPPTTPVWLFGAGHVGRALARILETLPCSLTVVDSRESALAALPPGRVRLLRTDAPEQAVAQAPAGAAVLVMTHSHEVDYAVCRQALARPDLAWVGLIGSETKATCFRLRLGRDGVDDARIATLVSPIGLGGIRSKLPSAIAVSVAAQLLQHLR